MARLIVTFFLFLFFSVSVCSETFPADPFNGLQVIYSVSGAELGGPVDTPGFTWSRLHKGTVGEGLLTVSGSVQAVYGYGGSVSVNVWAGGESKSYTNKGEAPFKDEFTVSVPIPKDAKIGGFSINLAGNYNAGSRGVVVKGDFSEGGESEEPAENISEQNEEPCEGLGDSTAKFIWVSRLVEIFPDSDPDSIRSGHERSIINVCDHVVTGEESGAQITFTDLSTILLKEESEVVIIAPPKKEGGKGALGLLAGKLWMNIQKVAAGESIEVKSNWATVGIKGTTVVVESHESKTDVKVLDGVVTVKSHVNGREAEVSAGQMVSADKKGLSKINDFNIDEEVQSWGKDELTSGQIENICCIPVLPIIIAGLGLASSLARI